MSDHHAHRAFELLAQLPHTPHVLNALELGSAATAHALLAIDARLGELVEQLRTANAIAAFQSGVVAPSEYDRAAAAARQLLSLPKEQPFT